MAAGRVGRAGALGRSEEAPLWMGAGSRFGKDAVSMKVTVTFRLARQRLKIKHLFHKHLKQAPLCRVAKEEECGLCI